MASLEKLKEIGTLVKCNTDQFFFYEGQPGNTIYIILAGKVGVMVSTVDGFAITVTTLGAGEFFGEMSLLENLPRSASIVALEPTLAISIDENNFNTFICRQPDMTYKILKAQSRRIRQLTDEMKTLKQPDPTPSQENTGVVTKEKYKLSSAGSGLFHDGHKTYGITAPDSHRTFLYTKEVECPICYESFTTQMQRSSKAKLDHIDPDLRQHFVDFEPLWYMMWICPHCYYTNFYTEFQMVHPSMVRVLKSESTDLKSKISINLTEKRTIDEVFALYYIGLYCASMGTPKPISFAKFWLRLMWLYDDVKDTQMSELSAQKAFEYYYNAVYNSSMDVSEEQQQRLLMLLGELALRCGNHEEMLRSYQGAIKIKGNPGLSNQIRDRYQEIKQKIPKV